MTALKVEVWEKIIRKPLNLTISLSVEFVPYKVCLMFYACIYIHIYVVKFDLAHPNMDSEINSKTTNN